MYRARDTKLDRDVALKVLPQAFTDDPDRLARFKRERHVPGCSRWHRSRKKGAISWLRPISQVSLGKHTRRAGTEFR